MISLDWLHPKKMGHSILFYFMPEKHVTSNLNNGRIKVSQFSECNDVFELSSFPMKSKESREKHKKWINEVGQTLGLICLSESWRNPLMWAHYANNGKGVCLVLSVKDSQKVKYITKRCQGRDPFNFPKMTGGKDFYEFCSTKFSAWKYEKEHRVFCEINQSADSRTNGSQFKKFDESFQLLGVINGPRPVLSKKQICEAARKNIDYFQVRPAFRDFRMVIQNNKSLWKI
jgi:hypothetical protein